MNADDANARPTADAIQPRIDRVALGAIYGLISAVGYTGANIFLRAVSDCDPIWVSCVKTFPTLALVGPWLLVLASKQIRIIPPRKALVAILCGGFVGHLAGNVLFQWSLGVIGIALAVPITLGAIIGSGALMGRFFLGEKITTQGLAAIHILIVAVCILSLGAPDAYASISSAVSSAAGANNYAMLALGIGAAAVSGLAYSVLGIVIRYGVTGRATVSATMVLIATVGLISLGGMSWLRLGPAIILKTSPADFWIMILAGICNAVAFLTLTKALQLTTVTYINSLNASQAAMAALAGIWIFNEPISGALIAGVALTMIGLVLMKGRDQTDWHSEGVDVARESRGASGQKNSSAS